MSIAESLLGVVIGEAMGQGQATTASGGRTQQNQQRPLAALVDAVAKLCNRILHATLKVNANGQFF